MGATIDGERMLELQRAFKRRDVAQALTTLKGAPLNYDETRVLEHLIKQVEENDGSTSPRQV